MKLLQLTIVVASTLFASMGIVALSWHRDAPGVGGSGQPIPLVRARGVLSEVDVAAGRVTLAVDEGPLELRVDSATTVFVSGRVGHLDELDLGALICAAWERGPSPTAEWLEPCAPSP